MIDYPETGIEYLKRVRQLPRELRSLMAARRECWAEITSIKAIDPSKEWVSGGGVPAGLDAQVVKWEACNERIVKSFGELAELRCEVEMLLMRMPDPDQRAALRCYYLAALSEQECIDALKIGRTFLGENRKKGEQAFETVYRRYIRGEQTVNM